MAAPIAYIAASFRHTHGVRLLGRSMRDLGFSLLDWTEKAAPPPGLTPLERRRWMDTDSAGGQVFAFCRNACVTSHLVVYFGASGQDAGVEVGMAHAAGAPVLGIRGPLEGPGLMLHGAVDCWVERIEDALALLEQVARHAAMQCRDLPREADERVQRLCRRLPAA
ncbi:MAG: translation initiation factor 2 [Deltaproteobacteria bacterium]|nr:translation initiation factor 2 [Deltaproteobacteria bacterium]